MKVSRDLLDFALAMAKSSMPNEMLGLLRKEGDVVTDLVLAPQTTANEVQVFYHEESLPIDPDVVGSVHSHPNGVTYPSDTDLQMFRSRGRVHIILGAPYGPDDWRAFDRQGDEIKVDVVDVQMDDRWAEEFRGFDEFEEDLF